MDCFWHRRLDGTIYQWASLRILIPRGDNVFPSCIKWASRATRKNHNAVRKAREAHLIASTLLLRGLGSFIALDGVVVTDIYGLYIKCRWFKFYILATAVFCFLPSLIYYFKLKEFYNICILSEDDNLTLHPFSSTPCVYLLGLSDLFLYSY